MTLIYFFLAQIFFNVNLMFSYCCIIVLKAIKSFHIVGINPKKNHQVLAQLPKRTRKFLRKDNAHRNVDVDVHKNLVSKHGYLWLHSL